VRIYNLRLDLGDVNLYRSLVALIASNFIGLLSCKSLAFDSYISILLRLVCDDTGLSFTLLTLEKVNYDKIYGIFH